ncbi:M23 family metallopeptidase [Falsiruegeria mediterranea]
MYTFLSVVVASTVIASSTFAKSPPVQVPSNAPPIISDYKSRMGANNLPRSSRHQGLDVGGPNGMAILAAADGAVKEVDVGTCWGPTIVIDHGLGPDRKPLIAAYGHLGPVSVKAGQRVKRGQMIAKLGNNHKEFRCIVGVRHLHFQLGRKWRSGAKGTYWGHVRYLVDGKKGVNPHLYWADGPGKVTCFEKGNSYPQGTLTYPAPCK